MNFKHYIKMCFTSFVLFISQVSLSLLKSARETFINVELKVKESLSFVYIQQFRSSVFASDPRFNRYLNKINSTKKKLCIGMCLTCFSLNLVISGQNRKYSKHQIFVPFSLFYTKVSSRNFRHIEYYNYFFYIKEAVY